MPVNRGHDNLTHSIVGILGHRTDRPTRNKFGVQAIDVIDIQVAKPIVRTKRARVHVGWALA
jgi:hypothetical protein